MNRRKFLLLSVLTPVLAKEFTTINNDTYLNKEDMITLITLNDRLKRVKRFVGYGNFNILSLNHAFYYGRNYSAVGAFTKDEQNLIEKLFYSDPKEFGFYGNQTTTKINQRISKKDIIKIPHSGHYVYKGKPLDDYKRIIKDVGSDLILTSGIRNVVKQLSLYTNKLVSFHGNLSLVSSIIAPPAYSYHTISDFDIGKKSWGKKNFTSAFATTSEFKQMKQLEYISLRYTVNNKAGVRYEPWHVKVI